MSHFLWTTVYYNRLMALWILSGTNPELGKPVPVR